MYQKPHLQLRLDNAIQSIKETWQDIHHLPPPETPNEVKLHAMQDKLIATLKLVEDTLSGNPDIKMCNNIIKNLDLEQMPVRVDQMTKREIYIFDNLSEIASTIRFVEEELDEEEK